MAEVCRSEFRWIQSSFESREVIANGMGVSPMACLTRTDFAKHLAGAATTLCTGRQALKTLEAIGSDHRTETIMTTEKLACSAGPKAITTPFQRYNSIGKEEVEAARVVIESGNLSQFLGCWEPDFFGGPKVQALKSSAPSILAFGVSMRQFMDLGPDRGNWRSRH